MRFTGNFFSEWAHRGGSSSNHSLLISLVACAVVAAASGAVILSLVGSPVTEPNRSSASPRAIVRAAATPEATEIQGRANVETPPQPAMTSRLSSGAEPVTQTESQQPMEVPSQELQKHNHQRTRESHWQGRLAHAFWPFRHISSRREELTSGAR
jgi:hypothetical protein